MARSATLDRLAWLGLLLAAACGGSDEHQRLVPIHRFADPSPAVSVTQSAVGGPWALAEIDRDVRIVLPGDPFVRSGADREPAGWGFARSASPREPGGSRRAVHESGAVRVPPGGLLEFAIGIAKATPKQGPVRFELLTCAGETCTSVFADTLDPAVEADRGWHEHRIALGGPRTRTFRFRFEMSFIGRSPQAESRPVWANPTLYAPAPDGASPSLLLVSIDTLAARHVSAYGYPRATTPFLDSLADRGVLFERCISAATTTGPSHMTLFTSLAPVVHGLMPGDGSFTSGVPAETTRLAEHLRAAGFDTAAFTDGGPLAWWRGFARGFDRYVENIGQATGASGSNIELTLAQGLEWLRNNRGKRSFLFLHSFQVHTPYSPPEGYDALFHHSPQGLARRPGVPRRWDPARYDREIRYVDDSLASFFDAAGADGLLDDTIVVVTSDHGEAFLEHGFLAHGPDVHEEVLQVPLLVAGPGIRAGARVAAPVGLIDLMPTLLELAGAPTPESTMGRSFAALLRGEADAAPWRKRPIYGSAYFGSGRREGGRWVEIAMPVDSVSVDQRKLIRYPAAEDGGEPRFAYYDLARDPEERVDLYRDDPEAAADLRALLEERAETLGALRERLERSSGVSGPEPAASLEEERREQLRALGYLK